MLAMFSPVDICGALEIAEKSGLAIDAEKNDGTFDGTVAPLEPELAEDVICCADAGNASAKTSIIPRNITRLRTVHLPRFENRPIQPYEEAGP